jgi:hypothetical protein
MVKWILSMDTANPQALPAPPSLMKSLVSGFESVSNHFLLIVFPIVIDLVLWFGPKISLRTFLTPWIDRASVTYSEPLWQDAIEQFNLLSAIRSFPIGVPSLMASRNPAISPFGQGQTWDVQTPQSILLIWIALSVAGLLVGTFYFLYVARAATGQPGPGVRQGHYLGGLFFKTLKLMLLWFAILLGFSFPFACALIFLGVLGIGTGAFAFLPMIILAAWFIFPLFFSPHAMILKNQDVWASIRDSAQVARSTMPASGLLILLVLVLSEGLDVLWRLPPENSWFSLVGVAGHAFVNTSLLAATFIYFRDADNWLRQMLNLNHAASLWELKRKNRF